MFPCVKNTHVFLGLAVFLFWVVPTSALSLWGSIQMVGHSFACLTERREPEVPMDKGTYGHLLKLNVPWLNSCTGHGTVFISPFVRKGSSSVWVSAWRGLRSQDVGNDSYHPAVSALLQHSKCTGNVEGPERVLSGYTLSSWVLLIWPWVCHVEAFRFQWAWTAIFLFWIAVGFIFVVPECFSDSYSTWC